MTPNNRFTQAQEVLNNIKRRINQDTNPKLRDVFDFNPKEYIEHSEVAGEIIVTPLNNTIVVSNDYKFECYSIEYCYKKCKYGLEKINTNWIPRLASLDEGYKISFWAYDRWDSVVVYRLQDGIIDLKLYSIRDKNLVFSDKLASKYAISENSVMFTGSSCSFVINSQDYSTSCIYYVDFDHRIIRGKYLVTNGTIQIKEVHTLASGGNNYFVATTFGSVVIIAKHDFTGFCNKECSVTNFMGVRDTFLGAVKHKEGISAYFHSEEDNMMFHAYTNFGKKTRYMAHETGIKIDYICDNYVVWNALANTTDGKRHVIALSKTPESHIIEYSVSLKQMKFVGALQRYLMFTNNGTIKIIKVVKNDIQMIWKLFALMWVSGHYSICVLPRDVLLYLFEFVEINHVSAEVVGFPPSRMWEMCNKTKSRFNTSGTSVEFLSQVAKRGPKQSTLDNLFQPKRRKI
jgi:hypothetical protein